MISLEALLEIPSVSSLCLKPSKPLVLTIGSELEGGSALLGWSINDVAEGLELDFVSIFSKLLGTNFDPAKLVLSILKLSLFRITLFYHSVN